ncbi:Nucleoside-diphosphate-sugar epimerase [Elusimicrobium minutum Pei191]|uniref:Nucleoside-diphosphate-sugar epimerase n=1 Tax=Elusimicrobium minutum (strain Pei191) TaxID=445932 RepID=B2KBI2_ELUMP|nr:NAD-dependent epimerase/dehydratase family protein [Elusimicrobium minutum]ACC98004.1 Nucleoside-diphosphate-sugar epimerase [Elusimicrobium minutum Pei191]
MKFAITGGAGFIGGALTKKLNSMGHSVRILTRGSGRKSADPQVEYITAKYTDVDSLANALEGCDGVFHLAAAIFAFNYKEFEAANVLTTRNLVDAAAKTNSVKYFTYMSSQAAGGYSADLEHIRTEDDKPKPASDYGRTKLGGENAVESLPARIKKIIFRPPIVYGKNDSGVSKIADWVKMGIMVNTSKGDAYFNFIHVDDLVNAIVKPIEDESLFGGIYYVCENKPYNWKFFIYSMADAMKVKRPFMFTAPLFVLHIVAFLYEIIAKLFNIAPALNYDKVKEASIKGHWVSSSKKWIDRTGQQFTSLEDGLRKSF